MMHNHSHAPWSVLVPLIPFIQHLRTSPNGFTVVAIGLFFVLLLYQTMVPGTKAMGSNVVASTLWGLAQSQVHFVSKLAPIRYL